MSETIVDSARAFDAHLQALGGDSENVGKVEPNTYEETVYTVHLGDSVATCYGGATFTADPNEFAIYNFEITLGPANSKRLVDFLLSLPDEPGEGDDEPVGGADV